MISPIATTASNHGLGELARVERVQVGDLLEKLGHSQMLGLRVHQVSRYKLFLHLTVEDVFVIYDLRKAAVLAAAPTRDLMVGFDHRPKKILSGNRNQLTGFDYTSNRLSFIGKNCKPCFRQVFGQIQQRESLLLQMLPRSEKLLLSFISQGSLFLLLFNTKTKKLVRQSQFALPKAGAAGFHALFKLHLLTLLQASVVLHITIVANYTQVSGLVATCDFKRSTCSFADTHMQPATSIMPNIIRCGVFRVCSFQGIGKELSLAAPDGKVAKLTGELISSLREEDIVWTFGERGLITVQPVDKGEGGFRVREGRVDGQNAVLQSREWFLGKREDTALEAAAGPADGDPEQDWHGFWSYCQNYRNLYYWPKRNSLFKISLD